MTRFWLAAIIAAAISHTSLGTTPQAVELLSDHCRSCHGMGSLRFFYSYEPAQVWHDLCARRAPNSQERWLDAIRTVLNWPSDDPPPFDEPMEPGRDWMPKGRSRILFAEDRIDDEPARRWLLRFMDENGCD